MKVFLAQLLLAALGVALALVPPERLGFLIGAADHGALRMWFQSFELFAIPICLFLVQIWAKKVSLTFSLAWGVWLTICAVRLGLVGEAWYADWPAGVVVSFSGLLALALVVFSAIKLTAKT